MMKTLLVICVALACTSYLHRSPLEANSAATTRPDAYILTTKSFVVTVFDNRQEGDVTTDNVIYEGVSRRTHKCIHLKGSDWHTIARDGTPGRFLGYQFKNGDISYLVLEEGRLEVVRGDSEVLVDEVGT
jgi:hypothetical protein